MTDSELGEDFRLLAAEWVDQLGEGFVNSLNKRVFYGEPSFEISLEEPCGPCC